MSMERRSVLQKARWTEYQHLKYCLYIILYSYKQNHADPSLNRRGKFFKGLARWLRFKKTAQQCRTHHIKQIEHFGHNIHEMRKAFLQNLYFIRRLQISHLWIEVDHHLRWLAEDTILSLAEEEEAKERARKIIAEYSKQMQNAEGNVDKQCQAVLMTLEGSDQGEEKRERTEQFGQSHNIFRQQNVQVACESELFLPDCVDLDCSYNPTEHQY